MTPTDLLDRALDLLVGEVAVVRLAEIPELRAHPVQHQGLRGYLAGERAGMRFRPSHRHDRKVVGIRAAPQFRQIEQLGNRLHEVALQQRPRDELSRERAPPAVGAQNQGVVFAQQGGLRQLHLRERGRPDAVEDLVAIRMGRDGLLANAALVDQHLHPGMIPRLRLDPAFPNVIEARIAHVRPISGRILHDASHAGGARRLDQVARLGVIAEREMCVDDALLQKTERVGELGLGFALERLGEELRGDLRGHLPVQVPAHAVGDDHEQCVAGVGVAGAILVRRAASLAAFLEDRESHRPSRFINALRTLWRRELLRCTSGSFSRSSTFCSANTLCGRFM